MSEDTDERMDRATRIRQMREGQRESATTAENGDDDGGDGDGSTETSSKGDDASNGDDTSSSPDSSPTPDATDDDQDGSADAAADSSGESTGATRSGSTEPAASLQSASDDEERPDPEATGDEPAQAGESSEAADAESATDSAVDQAAAAAAQPAPEAETADELDEEANELDEEAAAAAERAAQAAATVTGDGASGAVRQGQTGTETATGTAADADQSAGTTASAAPMQGPTGVELPDEESVQAAVADEVLDDDAGNSAEPATGRGVDAKEAATAEETVRVLEFTLGDEHYCLDIAHVEEIVKRESITRVPNTPEYVEGVVDLRGQITTILDPKLLLDIDQEGPESLLVVFAPEAFEDQGAIGWVVDEVRQVAPIAKSEVSSAPVDADYIEGVIDRDDDEAFVIWTNPEMAIRIATGERESGE